MIKELNIKDTKQVQHISELASEAPYKVFLATDTVMLDARSLLGLYALVGKRVNVVAADHANPRSFEKLVSEMES